MNFVGLSLFMLAFASSALSSIFFGSEHSGSKFCCSKKASEPAEIEHEDVVFVDVTYDRLQELDLGLGAVEPSYVSSESYADLLSREPNSLEGIGQTLFPDFDSKETSSSSSLTNSASALPQGEFPGQDIKSHRAAKPFHPRRRPVSISRESDEIRVARYTASTVRADLNKEQPLPRGTHTFKGVPYAVPPTGPLRFSPPLSLEDRPRGSDTILRQRPGARSCVQFSERRGFMGEEDCLYLNIYRPAEVSPSAPPLPVLVYFLDGNMARGHLGVRKGTALASVHNVIVVTPMFRLGPLGFWAAEELEDEEGGLGNWGQLDQIEALKWINKHIASFGGDPHRVTIWGGCTGGGSVLWHLVSPLSANLFHGAVVQSAMVNPYVFQRKADSFKFYDWLARRMGCFSRNDLNCVRRVLNSDLKWAAIDVEEMVNDSEVPEWSPPLYPLTPVGPTIDGRSLPSSPFQAFKEGRFHRVPLILGVVENEMEAMILAAGGLKAGFKGPPSTLKEVTLLAEHIFQSRDYIDKVKSLVPQAPYFSTFGTDKGAVKWIARVLRDVFFHAPWRYLSSMASLNGHRVFAYNFGVRLIPNKIGWLKLSKFGEAAGKITLKDLGTFHISDVLLSFKLFTDKKGVMEPSNDMFSIFMGPTWGGAKRLHWASDLLSASITNLAFSGSPLGPQALPQPSPHMWKGTGYLQITAEKSKERYMKAEHKEFDSEKQSEERVGWRGGGQRLPSAEVSAEMTRWACEEFEFPWHNLRAIEDGRGDLQDTGVGEGGL